MNTAKPLFSRETPKRLAEPIIYTATVPVHFGAVSLKEKIRRTGNTYWLLSFPFLNTLKADVLLQQMHDERCHVFLDSGAHTFQNLKLKPTTGPVKSYDSLFKSDELREEYLVRFTDYCKKEGSKFDCYANFDYWPNGKMIYDMQKRLEGDGIFPFPVEHGDDGMVWLQKYIDEGYRYMGISKTLRWNSRDKAMFFFDRVFNLTERYGVMLHGFAITDVELMFRFPWYSVDSTTWMQVSAYGSILSIQEGRTTPAHVSRAPSKQSSGTVDLEWLRTIVESHGFDFELMRYWGDEKEKRNLAWHERSLYNIYVLLHYKEMGAKISGGEKKWKSLLSK